MFAVCILGVGMALAADGGSQSLDGTWELVSVAEDGGKAAKPRSKTWLIFQDGKCVLRIFPKSTGDADNPGTFVESRYTADVSKKPATLDLTPLKGPDKGKTIHAIYVIEKGELKICQTSLPEQSRPEDFGSKRGTIVRTFKKQ